MVKRKRGTGTPDLLYHYTSIHGVKGIMKDGAVWASHAHFLNDSKELGYAMEIAKIEFHRLTADWAKRGNLKKLKRELESELESREHLIDAYVFSLSEMPDQLSQWRAYCPDDGGYAIWFNTNRLRKQLRAQGFRLVRCVYDQVIQRRRMKASLSRVVDQVSNLRASDLNQKKRWEIAEALSKTLSNLACCFKHPDFQEEREWRAVSLWPGEELEHGVHINGPVIVPHVMLRLDAVSDVLPIQHVTAGPGPHQESASFGLWLFLQDDGINVTNSRTPLRHFQ